MSSCTQAQQDFAGGKARTEGHTQLVGDAPQLNRFNEIELSEVFKAVLTFASLRTQLLTFFGTVSIAGVSVAFTLEKAGLMFASATMLLAAIIVDSMVRRILVRFYYRCFTLQTRFAPGDADTYLTLFFMGSLRRRVADIASLGEAERTKALTLFALTYLPLTGFWVPAALSALEIACGCGMMYFFQWQLF